VRINNISSLLNLKEESIPKNIHPAIDIEPYFHNYPLTVVYKYDLFQFDIKSSSSKIST